MEFSTDDTIAAIASASGGALRGIVRISGPGCEKCALTIFRTSGGQAELSPAAVQSPFLVPGRILLPALDASLLATLYLWPTSRSYTRQPTAELHTVGSPPLLEAVLAEVCRHGARLARPGEFTLRAFLAGRLDLTQAEAVLGVIDAGSEQQLKTALAQLAGGIGGPLVSVRSNLLDLLADLEAGLDFVEEDIEFISRERLLADLRGSLQSIEEVARQMQSRGDANRVPRVVLCGAPNAGKSSLFNALAGDDAAIVSSVAGTTRDFVSRRVRFEGVELELIDTAGLGDSPADELSVQAQSAARDELETCDLRLWCFDGATAGDADLQVASARIPVLDVLTKWDLRAGENCTTLATSSRTGQGIVELRRRIVTELSSQHGDSVASTAARCRESLARAADSMGRALTAAEESRGEEFVAAEVRAALDDLGHVLGTVYTEDILDRIFSRFCIGK